MHWAYELAQKLIAKHPDEVITCASGVSPSGYIHVGNFREIATTYFVTQALTDLGGKPRFILSWDDYDRLRKIPVNVIGVSEIEIGKPYTKVTGPTDAADGESYATFFEKMFTADLARLGIQPESIYETAQYEGGAYDEQLKLVLNKRKEIYDILARFRTEAPNEEQREQYYPISLYCDVCGHDSTKITDYDSASGTISYTCTEGHNGTQVVGAGQKIKLHWKIDWPMRWCYENVAFEPGGKDHSSKNGSFDVATAVVKEIFGGKPPLYEPYDFVNIKGQTKKMSSSSGNIITLQELLQIYTPEMVFYLYAKYLPKAQFDLGLDDDVLRNYAEFERKIAGVKAGTEKDETIKQIIKLTGVDLTADYPAFGHVVSILSLTGNDQAIAASLLQQEKEYSETELQHILPRAAYWIENDAQSRLMKVLTEKSQTNYATLLPAVQKEVKQFRELLVGQPELEGQELMQAVYDLTPTTDKAEKRQEQRALFKAIYQLTLGQESGPRIPLLVEVVGREKMIELLSF
ncbi:lysine--tRNA ligase [Enterococcus sp. LJL99]